MQNKKQENNNLFNDAPASRFVVDLRGEIADSRQQTAEDKNNKFDLESFYEKLEGLHVKDKIRSWREKKGSHLLYSTSPSHSLKKGGEHKVFIDREKIKSAVEKVAKNSSPEILQNESRLAPKYLFILSNAWPAIKNAVLAYGARIKKFIIAPLKFVYKIFYNIGWSLVYLARLFYFTGLALKNLFYNILRPVGGVVKMIIARLRWSPLRRDSSEARERDYSGTGEGGVQIIAQQLRRSPLRENETRPKAEARRFRWRAIWKTAPRQLALPIKLVEPKMALKPTFAFALTLILLVLPFKAFTYYKSLDLNSLRGRVLGISEEAIDQLVLGGQSAGSMEFSEAQDNFSRAAGKFVDAEKELSSISDTLLKIAGLIPNDGAQLASESKDILRAGKLAAMLGESMSAAVNGALSGGTIGGSLNNFINYGAEALVIAKELYSSVIGIDEKNVPEEYRNKFISAKGTFGFMLESLDELVRLAGKGKLFVAENDFKRYLIVFQNNAEMRATGGFIGSYALLDMQNGQIKNIEIPTGGSYDTEGGLKEKIIAPEPLHLVNPLWHFWDANWWPDWPTSAEKLEWFYEKSGGPTVDGVIALTPDVLEKMLEIIGSVDMTEKYGVVISAENFWQTTREIIETTDIAYKEAGSDASDEEAKPKAIIGDLARKIMEEMPKRLDSQEKLLGLVKSFEKLLDEKHILFYFNDEKLQGTAEEYGWDGAVKHSSWDYLSVINSNIAGGKSDRKINETINITAEVQDDGSIINTLKIKREHAGLKFVDLTGVRNVDWMRIYVPLGSQLLNAKGFQEPDEIYFEKPEEDWIADADVLKSETGAQVDESSRTKIYEEAGKTVFANWSMVDPGSTVEVELKYKLPFKFQDKEPFTVQEIIKNALNPGEKEPHVYALLAQKQAGSESNINFNLVLPENMKIIWNYPADVSAWEGGLRISDKLDTDKYWAFVLSK